MILLSVHLEIISLSICLITAHTVLFQTKLDEQFFVDNVGDVLLFLIKLSDEIIKNEIHLDIYLVLFALFLIYYNKRIKMSF